MPTWPAETTDGMSDAQAAVMEAPYHPRMNRTYVTPAGEAKAPRARESFKIEFDERVFGTRYF